MRRIALQRVAFTFFVAVATMGVASASMEYEIVQYTGFGEGWSLDGGIINLPDGTSGSITPDDFVDWNVRFTSPRAGGTTLTSMTGTATLTHVSPLYVLTADADQIYIDFQMGPVHDPIVTSLVFQDGVALVQYSSGLPFFSHRVMMRDVTHRITLESPVIGDDEFDNLVIATRTAIPEPTTLLLAMLGMTSVCCWRRRR